LGPYLWSIYQEYLLLVSINGVKNEEREKSSLALLSGLGIKIIRRKECLKIIIHGGGNMGDLQIFGLRILKESKNW
jgi:exopolysaccharide biosynthesis predicted pyruvyltransferase EpsI